MSNGVVQFDVAESVIFRAIIQQDDYDNAVRAIAEMEGLEPDEVGHDEVTTREIFHV